MIEPSRSSILSEFDSLPARDVFFSLFHGGFSSRETQTAANYLHTQLVKAAHLDSDLPDNPDDLVTWMHAGVEEVGRRYRAYLDERQAGKPRRYFRSKSHALNFLRGVAPTKLVDGAWLYGLLSRWQDARFLPLIQTYLEELGEGQPTKNHVVLYRKLLASHGLENWDDLSDEHFVQGAIQLALAYNADKFLPEVVGFNLGYEQLPLHLLITSYELKELGIDPYYFTLHVTVDNADSGHARKAVDAIFASMPRLGDRDEWLRRVRNGYNLNLLGSSTESVIGEFDLESELCAIFRRKAQVGQYAHSDYRQVNGCTVNNWLSQPEKMPEFIREMEQTGWFKRGQDPRQSRFWKMIQSDSARMFGVFSVYEQQVIFDWIADGAPDIKPLSVPLSPETRQRVLDSLQAARDENDATDFDAENRELERQLAQSQSAAQMMQTLIELISPANHHSAPGLKATRLFNGLLL